MNIPSEIITKLKDEKCVAFIGAGLSIGAGLPDWKRLIEQMISWCEEYQIVLPNKNELNQLLSEKDFTTLADTLIECMGKSRYQQFLKEVFRKGKLKPTETHKLLPNIPFSAILTTNYDKLIEGAYTATNEGEIPANFTHLDTSEISNALQSGNFHIIKTHGDIDRVDSIVLGRKEYRELLHNNNAYKIYLQQMIISKTILFLGFSLTDPDLFCILDELRVIFKDNTSTHYALMDETNLSEIKIKQFRTDYNIIIIPYKPSSNLHAEVPEFLKELIKLTPKKFLTNLDKAKQDLENIDSHYEVIASTNGNFVFKEKYPGASEEKPLKFRFTLIADTKTEEGKETLDDWKNFVEKGEKIIIKSQQIESVEFPFIFEKVYGDIIKNPVSQEITIGPSHHENIFRFRLVVIPNGGGEPAAIEGIELKIIQVGTKQLTLSNEHQKYFCNYKITRSLEPDEDGKCEANVLLSFSFNDSELSLFQLVCAEKVIAALAKGGIFRHEHIDGKVYEYPILTQPSMKSIDPYTLRVLEDLLLIEQKTGISFDLPERFSEEEMINILNVAYSIKTGRGTGSVNAVLDVNRKAVESMIKPNSYFSTSNYTEYYFTVLNKTFSVGFVWAVCDKLFISETDKINLTNQLKANLEKQIFTINIETNDEFPSSAYFIEYLPPDEFEKLHENLAFREKSLDSLLALLFHISSENRKVDFTKLIKVFELATKQISNSGKPFNMLKRCTVEEFIKTINPFLNYYKELPLKKFLLELSRMKILPENQIDFVLKELS
jgi:NAD-dependent SIR2 family protein deacetylase